MINLYTNGIRLSDPDHVIIYDEILKNYAAVPACTIAQAYSILHKAGILIGLANEKVRELLLVYPHEQSPRRAKELVEHHLQGTLARHIYKEQQRLGIEPDIEVSKALVRLPIDLKAAKSAQEELNELEIDLNTVREKLEEFPNNYSEVGDNDSGRGSGDDESLDSPASSFMSSPNVLENTPPPTAIQTQLHNEPFTQDEAQFKILSSKLGNPDDAARILHALQTQDAQSFETIQGFLLNHCISREFFLKKNLVLLPLRNFITTNA